jgi:putative DNA primase/helicase
VPAVRGGSSTVFDRGPKTLSARDFERWTRNTLISIRESCERNHGKVIRPYIEHLIANVDAVESTIKSRIAEFEKTVNASALDGALQHAAKNFGLIFAGGCLGIDAKLLPWDRERLLRAIAACFEDALRESKAHENTATKGRKQFRKNLSSANLAEHTPSAKFGPNDRSGFWEKNNGVLIYTIHAKIFRRWFHNQAQLAATLNWLERDGFLVLSRKKSPSNNPANTEWAEQSPRWPNGNNVRSIVFRDPFDREAIPQSLKNA